MRKMKRERDKSKGQDGDGMACLDMCPAGNVTQLETSP
jgi:hypothetical protein